MLQTRVYTLTLHNKGVIAMDYNWQLVMESPPHAGASHAAGRSVTFATHTEADRPMTAGTELVSSQHIIRRFLFIDASVCLMMLYIYLVARPGLTADAQRLFIVTAVLFTAGSRQVGATKQQRVDGRQR